MGSFDSVYAECPQCGEQVEFQSKSGLCEDKNYHSKSVPAMVVEGTVDKPGDCAQCGFRFYLTLEGPMPRVTLEPIGVDTAIEQERRGIPEWD